MQRSSAELEKKSDHHQLIRDAEKVERRKKSVEGMVQQAGGNPDMDSVVKTKGEGVSRKVDSNVNCCRSRLQWGLDASMGAPALRIV